MRFLTTSLAIVAAALAVTACSGKSASNSSDQSSATVTSAAADTSTEATAKAAGDVPTYPGATTQASGTSSMGSGTAAGTVMTTSDSFDKVYTWYQKNMPAGSEKAHMTTPVESAVFMVGEAGKSQTSVTIGTRGGKTMISIAHVKM